MSTKRKLAAIMFTDIVGYTELVRADEEKARELLRVGREIQRSAIDQFEGKWLKDIGEGMLVQFESAGDAVTCALTIQQRASRDLDHKIRIGIHLGDVTMEDHDIFGDGVNIASRLHSIADPGGIYLSETVQAAIGARKEINTEYLGEIVLKNVDHPVGVYYVCEDWLPEPSKSRIQMFSRPRATRMRYVVWGAVIIAACVAWLFMARLWKSEPSRDVRLAVLPIADVSRDGDNEAFADGIHSALIDEIGTIHSFQVISRTSSSTYKGAMKPIATIAQELKIAFIVEGELEQMDDSVRLRLSLVQASPEQRIWSKDYVEASTNILKIYSDVALQISRATNVTLSSSEQQSLDRTRDVNPEAYKALLRSDFYLNNFNGEDFRRALQMVELAISLDPNYPEAYIALVKYWVYVRQMGLVSYAEAQPHIEEAHKKAMALSRGTETSELHSMIASNLAYTRWEWRASIKEFQQAIALNPSNAGVRNSYSYLLAIMQFHDEAKEEIDLAARLDPFNPFIESFYGWNFLYARKYEQAVEHSLTSLSISSSQLVAQDALRHGYHMLGRYEEAYEATRKLYVMMEMPEVVEALTTGFATGGYKVAMEHGADALAKRLETNFLSPESVAEMYAFAGMYDKALPWLERAYEVHDPDLHYLVVVPIYDPLRGNARFENLVRLIGVPQKGDAGLSADIKAVVSLVKFRSY